MNLRNRSDEPEKMDSGSDREEIRSALGELKIINKFLGGNAVTRKAIYRVKKKFSLHKINVLDAGSGSSDILLQKRIAGLLDITAVDKNRNTCTIIKEKKYPDKIVCADAMALPFCKKNFDVVHASLFLHHFNNEQISLVLNQFCSAAKYAVIINDLQRSNIAYYGFRILSFLFFENRLVRNDGLISVKRSFRRKELVELLQSKYPEFELEWRWAFRWLLIIYCNEIL